MINSCSVLGTFSFQLHGSAAAKNMMSPSAEAHLRRGLWMHTCAVCGGARKIRRPAFLFAVVLRQKSLCLSLQFLIRATSCSVQEPHYLPALDLQFH